MSSGSVSPERNASPRHRKREFIRSSLWTKNVLAKHHDEINSMCNNDVAQRCASQDAIDETAIIQKLEQKRRELDDQIAQYIMDKQREHDTLERELRRKGLDSSNENIDPTAGPNLEVDNGGAENLDGDRGRSLSNETLTLPVSRNIWSADNGTCMNQQDSSQGDRTSAHEREREFHELFTPFFLPLLDAGASQRSNSAPLVPNASSEEARGTEGSQSDHSSRQQARRAATEPFVKPAILTKSALRSPKKPRDKKKRVSLIIDDEIVRPSESPKETTQLPPTPTEEELMSMPTVTLTDADGTPIHVWVPDKARLPFPNEDALDYVMAVGGIMHHAIDIHVHDNHHEAISHKLPLNNIKTSSKEDLDGGAPLQRFPSDSLHTVDSTAYKFSWSSSSPSEGMFNMSPEFDRKHPSQPRVAQDPKSSPDLVSSSPTKRNNSSLINEQGTSLPPPTTATTTTTSSLRETSLSPTTSPGTSPSASSSSVRHTTSYIDKFSTSSNRLFGNIGDESTPQREATLAYMDDGGPSTSYVGGLSGSGVDNVDIGSAGYPSSLGASYMEQFAASRAMGQRAKHLEERERQNKPRPTSERASRKHKRKEGNISREDDEFLGEMEGV